MILKRFNSVPQQNLKIDLNFSGCPNFNSILCVYYSCALITFNYIERKSNNFHELTIKTKRILGLKLGQIQLRIIMTCAWRSAIWDIHDISDAKEQYKNLEIMFWDLRF